MFDKKFKMIDEDFTCNVCKRKVTSLGYSARDHCPYCLSSIHVDNNPGDRKNTCHGILEPIAIELKDNNYKIVYRCNKCGAIKKNTMARDDNMDLIISIMSHPEKY